MARPKMDQAPDLSEAQELTAGLIERLTCPAGKLQAFLRDTKAPGLRVRATPASAKNPQGVKGFVFEAKLNRQTIRRTIGDVRRLTIEAARAQARELAATIKNDKQDPRELERQQQNADAAQAAADAAVAVTVAEAWAAYMADRRPHWGERHYQDHASKAAAGGQPSNRGTRGRGVTVAGPLHPLMALPLRDLTAPVIEAWAAKEGKTRPTSARLAWRMLKAFVRWCAAEPAYKTAADPSAASGKKTRESLGKPGIKQDALLKEQLPAWFAAVRQIPNSAIGAYLQIALLTGARPGEVLALRWEDLNLQWRGMVIRDKVEGERIIPLTPFVAQLLAGLPRRSAWIFASGTSGTGYLTEPNHPHTSACKVAGIDGLTLHGLRRSFKSLTEWLEIPAGVVAQLMGHKPSATAEKHYTVRPLDLLRVHHEKIEAWILEQAGIVFDPKIEPGTLRVVLAA